MFGALRGRSSPQGAKVTGLLVTLAYPRRVSKPEFTGGRCTILTTRDQRPLNSGVALFEGTAAIVTGSSRGIGLAVARALGAQGAAVVVNGRVGEAVDVAVASLQESGAAAVGVVGDCADQGVVDQMLEAAQSLGELEALVACAGTPEPVGSSILAIDPAQWQSLIDAHLTSTFLACRAVAPIMAARGCGSIVLTSSHAFTGAFAGTGYPAAKGAINSLMYALAAELREHGVRVNAVCPGAATRLSDGADYHSHIAQLHERGILDELMYAGAQSPAPAEYVAALYAYLASPLNPETGQLFSGSGGYIGRFEQPKESLVTWRDHSDHPPWSLAEIADLLAPESGER